ncbi:MAG: AAA family ATPase [Oscillospiraceae bacterium]|nr:AAA family ATPase [Oscillospiraceae bacterium]
MLSEDIWQNGEQEYYINCCILNGNRMSLTVILLDANIDADEIVDDYLNTLELEFIQVKIAEITLYKWSELMIRADRNGYIDDDTEIFKRLDIDDVIPQRNSCKFKEYLLNIDPETDIRAEANEYNCAQTLLPELDRIEQGAAITLKRGHPVHYFIQSDSKKSRKELTKILIKALRQSGRIQTSRFAIAECTEHNGFGCDEYEQLDSVSHGAAILFDCDKVASEGGNKATRLDGTIEEFCEAMKRHKNEVQFIIGFPKGAIALKNRFLENLDGTAFVEITEEPLFGDAARNFLRVLSAKNNIEANEKLFAVIKDDEHSYNTEELEKSFEQWFSLELRSSVYPQYLSFNNHHDAARIAKGSAFEELNEMVGLTEAKSVITKALAYYKAQKLFKDKGFERKNTALHMLFTGNPGSAKTTAARLFAQIMKDNGLLSRGTLIECGRADIVDIYVGGTAPRVKNLFKKAKGGVLFIDEAYSLVDGESGMYGDEAINTIVQEMENVREDMVVIFAGYPDKMENFLLTNPGLRSRIAFKVKFDDYKENELFAITEIMAKQQQISLSAEVRDKLIPIFAGASQKDDFGNGRYARNLFEQALMSQAERLVAMDPDSVTAGDIRLLLPEDFTAAEISVKSKRRIGFSA